MDKNKEGGVVSVFFFIFNLPKRLNVNWQALQSWICAVLKVIKGLKQRILKLEQQCREKENALR